MRHRIAGKKLSRHRAHRKALFKNLINSLVTHGEIKTTESKAKAVRRIVDRLITRGKSGTLHARRLIAAFLQDKKVVNKIVDELAPVFKNRPGGYTRMTRLGRRRGDDAMMVKLELVERPKEKEEKKKERESKKTKGKKSNEKPATLKR